MRIVLGIRIEENCENDKIMSKHDCGSRKGCSIESALLEKILMLNLANRVGKQVASMPPYLDVCCDRQLPNTGGVVEESTGEHR